MASGAANGTAPGDVTPYAGTDASTPDEPQTAARLSCLDFIRGIAVIGILWANIVGYARPGIAYRWQASFYDPSFADNAVWLFQYIFVDGKLRGLFALLFGAGIVLFMERARAKGAPARWLQFRRLFWLALFGLTHHFLLFAGDILFGYAMLGMLAMWAVFWKPKWLIVIGALLYCADSVGGTIELGDWVRYENQALSSPQGSEIRKDYDAEIEGMLAEGREDRELMQNGSFGQIVGHRIETDRIEIFTGLKYLALDSLALMLIGAGLFRLGFFSGAFNRSKMIRWGSLGIGIGGVLHLAVGLWVIGEGFPVAKNFFAMYGPAHVMRLPMILGYAAILVAMSPVWAATWLGERLSAAGRMAFSNYLGTSLVMAIIFQGWGLGLFDQFTRVGLLGFVAFGAALMLLWSKPWLEHFNHGPLEWLWRCLTYWKIFPFRKTEAA